MREIGGYVFVEQMPNGATPIYGKAVDSDLKESGYENIVTNEICVFSNLQEMRSAVKIFVGTREGCRVVPARLEMRIAQTAEECVAFERLTDLVAVRIAREQHYTDTNIFGPINQDFLDLHHGILPCCRIDANGLLTFRKKEYGNRTFEVVMEARYQVQRQSDNCPTSIGTFKLRRLSK